MRDIAQEAPQKAGCPGHQSLMAQASNLTPEALIDLRRELRRFRGEFGAEQTLKLQRQLLERFRQIEAGVAVGHRHQFVLGATDHVLCLTLRPLL